jgi:hypothetical protein
MICWDLNNNGKSNKIKHVVVENKQGDQQDPGEKRCVLALKMGVIDAHIAKNNRD